MRALLLVVLLGGCADLLGVDDWREGPGSTSASSSGSPGGAPTGGASSAGEGAGTGGVGATSGGASAGGNGGGGGGGGSGTCMPAATCYAGAPPAADSPKCGDPAPSAACVPPPFDYCDCAGQTPAVFLEWAPGPTLLAVTLIAPSGDEGYALGINDLYCVNSPQVSCTTACTNDPWLYRWTNFEGHQSEVRSLEIWRQDDIPLCDVVGDGQMLFAITGL